MRVALLIDRFDPGAGGGERYAACLAQALAGRGHEVHVLANRWVETEGVCRFERLRAVRYPRWAKGLFLAYSARRALRSGAYDISHALGRIPWVDVQSPGGGAELAWLRQEIRSGERPARRLWLAVRRAASLKLVVNLLLERWSCSGDPPPFFIANSRRTREDLLRSNRVAPGRVEVIYPGVDLDRFNPAKRRLFEAEMRRRWGVGKGRVLLFMSHNFRLKGLGPLLEAMGRLRRLPGPWWLVVAGGGRIKPHAKKVEALGIGDRVVFAGPQAAPEQCYSACDLFLHPSFYDTFGLVCLEAMASGVPVLTTRCAGAHEIIETGREGWVLDTPGDADSMVEAIRILLTGGRLREMGDNARRKAEGYSWEAHLDSILAVYERAGRQRRGKADGSSPARYGP